VLDECRSIGAYFVVVSGGEPCLFRFNPKAGEKLPEA
jgi:hypothetical protein